MIKLTYKGRDYLGGTAKELVALGVPEDIAMQTENEHKSTQLRDKRDSLIRDTDWTQVLDSPLSESKKSEYAAYRQALRDIPQQYDSLDDVVWPVKPE